MLLLLLLLLLLLEVVLVLLLVHPPCSCSGGGGRGGGIASLAITRRKGCRIFFSVLVVGEVIKGEGVVLLLLVLFLSFR
jgi:hypothetical protein